MAIGVASIVSPKTAGVGLNVNGPLFGSVQSGAGPFVVLWFNGQNNSVVAASLDEILAGSGTVAAEFVGRRVKVNSPAGQNSWAFMVCVGNYNRNGSEVLLLQNPTGEYYLEALATQCTALPN